MDIKETSLVEPTAAALGVIEILLACIGSDKPDVSKPLFYKALQSRAACGVKVGVMDFEVTRCNLSNAL